MLARHVAPIVFNYVSQIFFHVRPAITIGARSIGAPFVLADYKEDDRVRCASPIFKPIAYKLGSTKGKRKYVVEKQMSQLYPYPSHFSLVTTFKG
jgi:hypothetical protein